MPEHWVVVNRSMALMGGVEDTTRHSGGPESPVASSSTGLRSWQASRSRIERTRRGGGLHGPALDDTPVHPVLARRSTTLAYAAIWVAAGFALTSSSRGCRC